MLENVLESSVILLEDSVLRGHVKRIVPLESELETAVSESFDTLVSVIHSHTDTTFSFVFVDFHCLFGSVISRKDNLKLSWFVNSKVSGFVLITKGVSSDNDRFLPSRDKSWNIADHDRLSKDSSIQVISDGSVGAFPHLFEAEFLDSCLVWRNGGAFDSNLAFTNSFSSVDGYFVISLISVLHSQVEVLDWQV